MKMRGQENKAPFWEPSSATYSCVYVFKNVLIEIHTSKGQIKLDIGFLKNFTLTYCGRKNRKKSKEC